MYAKKSEFPVIFSGEKGTIQKKGQPYQTLDAFFEHYLLELREDYEIKRIQVL